MWIFNTWMIFTWKFPDLRYAQNYVYTVATIAWSMQVPYKETAGVVLAFPASRISIKLGFQIISDLYYTYVLWLTRVLVKLALVLLYMFTQAWPDKF